MFRSFLFPKKSNLPLHPQADKLATMESMIFLKGSKNITEFITYLMDHKFEILADDGKRKLTSRYLAMQVSDLIKKSKIGKITSQDLSVIPEYSGFRDKVKDLLTLGSAASTPLTRPNINNIKLMENMIFLKGSKNITSFVKYLNDHKFEIPTGEIGGIVDSEYLATKIDILIKKNQSGQVTDYDLFSLPTHGGFRDKVKDLLMLDRQSRTV
jgi:protein involved in ribonucleotide reduction